MVEEPRGQRGAEVMPERQEGHLLKKRKWPLKGWHKVGGQGKGQGQMRGGIGGIETFGKLPGSAGCVCVKKKGPRVWLLSPHTFFSRLPGSCFSWASLQRYFVLEDGILRYANTRQDVSQGLGLAGGVWPQNALGRQGASGIPQSRARIPRTPFHVHHSKCLP